VRAGPGPVHRRPLHPSAQVRLRHAGCSPRPPWSQCLPSQCPRHRLAASHNKSNGNRPVW
jgi:hypothetical protein